jgi:hypothetical protein
MNSVEQGMTHQPAISFSISLLSHFNRAGGRTSNVRYQYDPMHQCQSGNSAFVRWLCQSDHGAGTLGREGTCGAELSGEAI